MSTATANAHNHLLQHLPGRERNKIIEQGELTKFNLGAELCDPGLNYRYVYFPFTGLVSLMARVKEQKSLIIGLIGNEGMFGATLALGIATAPTQAIVCSAGVGLRLRASKFRRILQDSPCLRRTLNHYLYMLIIQLSQEAACVHFHKVEARLARWLLIALDHTQENHFHLTHEFLALMLGVRRSSISIAAKALQCSELIRYTRGEIYILDRHKLEAAACSCYQTLAAENSAYWNKGLWCANAPTPGWSNLYYGCHTGNSPE
ncbi:Crp/Fnr family transcriptional regulator [Hahella aquimaris]|uniref:Crp/Fnr family transcriptional regulator n=1 Tax=Hahella sp. HNIBRBA332 TaxID=3015983 RepID=UPI00273A9446|nr:Crp/Fnr family transcriptional regulator [Hahella sp. HNIBRBA332]WLQ16327.1 Crp/Fnr family transcriptional regulator [Hahella sp. HNIBRBA332]